MNTVSALYVPQCNQPKLHLKELIAVCYNVSFSFEMLRFNGDPFLHSDVADISSALLLDVALAHTRIKSARSRRAALTQMIKRRWPRLCCDIKRHEQKESTQFPRGDTNWFHCVIIKVNIYSTMASCIFITMESVDYKQ